MIDLNLRCFCTSVFSLIVVTAVAAFVAVVVVAVVVAGSILQ